jgi:chitodextrinase
MNRRSLSAILVTAAISVATVLGAPAASAAFDTSPPSTPGTPVAPTVTNTSITLVWAPSSDNVGVTGYEIFRSPGSPVSFAAVGTSSMARFTDTGLLPGTIYLYQVRARDAAGNRSAFSPIAPAMTAGPCTMPPPAPGNLTLASIASNVVSLRWGVVVPGLGCSPAGFDILRAPGSSGGTFAVIARIGFATTFSDTTVSPATTYRYQVRARSANDLVSGPSNTLLVTTPQGCLLVPPPAPGNLTARNVTATSVSLTWFVTAAPGCALTYQILRAADASGGAFIQIGTSGGNSFTDVGLSPSTTYSYRARTRDADGNLSSLSNTVTITTSPPATNVP